MQCTQSNIPEGLEDCTVRISQKFPNCLNIHNQQTISTRMNWPYLQFLFPKSCKHNMSIMLFSRSAQFLMRTAGHVVQESKLLATSFATINYLELSSIPYLNVAAMLQQHFPDSWMSALVVARLSSVAKNVAKASSVSRTCKQILCPES